MSYKSKLTGAEVEKKLTTPTPEIVDTETSDLEIADEKGNILFCIKEGHLKVKGFDSEVVPDIIDTNEADLEIRDEAGNILLRLKDGHIETKHFNSKNLT